MRSSSVAALPASPVSAVSSAVGSAAVPALSACPNMRAISIDPNADQGINGAKSSGMPSGMPSSMASMVPTGSVASRQGSATKKNASPTASGKPASSTLVNRAISEALGLHIRSDIGELTSSQSTYPTARYAGDRLPTDRLLARHEITTLRKVVRSPWKPRLYGRATESSFGDNAGGAGDDSGAEPTPTGSVSNGASGHAGPQVDDGEGGQEFEGTATGGSDQMPHSTAAGEDAFETGAGSSALVTGFPPDISGPPEDSQPTVTASDDTDGVSPNHAQATGTLASDTLQPVPSSTGTIDGDGSGSDTGIPPSEPSSAVPGHTGDSSPEADGGAGSQSQVVPSGDSDQSAGNENGTPGAMPPSSGDSSDGNNAVTNTGTPVGGSGDGTDTSTEVGAGNSIGGDGTSPSAPNAGTTQHGDDSNSPPPNNVPTPPGGSNPGAGLPGNGESESQTPQAGAGSPSAGEDGGAEGNTDNGSGSSPSEHSSPFGNSPPSDNSSQSQDTSSGLDKTANSSGDDGNDAGEGSGVGVDAGESTSGSSGATTGAGAGAKINALPMAQSPKFEAGQKGTLLFIPSAGDVEKSGAADVNQVLASGQPVYEASGEINEGGVFLVDDQPMLTFIPSRVGVGSSPPGGAALPSISVSPPDEQDEGSQPTGPHSPAGAASVPASASITHAPEVEQPTGDEGESPGGSITKTMQRRWLEGRVAKKATRTKKGSPNTRTKAGAASTGKAGNGRSKVTSRFKKMTSAYGNYGMHSATKSVSHTVKTQSSYHVPSTLANVHASPTGSATYGQQYSSGGTSSEDIVPGGDTSSESGSYGDTAPSGSSSDGTYSDDGYSTGGESGGSNSGGDPSSGGEAGDMNTGGSGMPNSEGGNGGGAGYPPTDGSDSQVQPEGSGGSGGDSDQQLA